MVQDIHDEAYRSPLAFLQKKKEESPGKKAKEVNDILWYVSFVISSCFAFFYTVALYFTYFEDPKSFDKTFSNNQRQFVAPSKYKAKK